MVATVVQDASCGDEVTSVRSEIVGRLFATPFRKEWCSARRSSTALNNSRSQADAARRLGPPRCVAGAADDEPIQNESAAAHQVAQHRSDCPHHTGVARAKFKKDQHAGRSGRRRQLAAAGLLIDV